MAHSESIKNIAAALGKVQSNMPAAPERADNPYFKSRYADLGAVIETARPFLSDNGLSYSQLVIGDGGDVGITTLLMHTSGEWLETTVTLPLGETKGKLAQEAGSVLTYLRRYSLSALLGIYSEPDDDGNGSTATAQSSKSTPAKATAPVKAPAPASTLKPLTQTPAPMVQAAQELGGVPADVAAAMERKNSQGKRYGDFTDSQLQFVIESDKASADAKQAAGLILDWRIDQKAGK